MRICQAHWKALREEIVNLGYCDMIAKSGEDLAARMQQKPTARTFDPLMAAHNLILRNGLEALGLSLLAPHGEGEEHKCPVCEVEKLGATGWIHSAARGACEYAEKLKKAATQPE